MIDTGTLDQRRAVADRLPMARTAERWAIKPPLAARLHLRRDKVPPTSSMGVFVASMATLLVAGAVSIASL